MSSFYSDASIVLIPSGYKNQKIYCAKPTDGTGDLTFTRASSATRVQSNGLIEKVRTNLILQSNSFNTTWTTATSTVTSGQAGYDGTNNGWLLTRTGTSGYLAQSLVQSTLGVVSVYAKANVNNWFRIRVSATASSSAFFDLSNGTLGTVTSGQTSTITSVGNGWYRCTLTYSPTSSDVRLYVADADNDVSGTSGSVFIQAAQWELGDIATDYIPTTTAAVSAGPVSGLPRLDYLNSTCPKLLLEPQRTNLITFSEQLNNATWDNTLYPVTVTANQTASPSGYVDADLITPTAASSRHAVGESASGTAGSVYTASVFFKKGGARYVVLADGGDSPWHIVTADLDTATITNQTNATGTITSYGNGWYRVTCTFTRTNTSTIDVFVGASNTASAVSLPSFNDVTLTTFAWGVSLELGAYATSYIPTLSASVTRVADAASKTGISSLIGQTEGTLFVELSNLNNSIENEQIALSDGTDANTIKFVFGSVVGGVKAEGKVSSVAQFGITKTTSDFVSNKKIALAYKANDFVFYYNGEQVGVDTVGTVPAMSAFAFSAGSSVFLAAGNVKQLLIFKTRLTNAQLAELTA